jgi:large subunit ribosomal protein L34
LDYALSSGFLVCVKEVSWGRTRIEVALFGLTFFLKGRRMVLYRIFYFMATKRTYQPKKLRRARRHGFLSRMATSGGQKVVAKRRREGRKKLTV